MTELRRPGRLDAGRDVAVVAALGLSACTAGGGDSDNGPDADAKQTITVWHGFTGDNEVKAFDAAVAAFHAKFPNITVKAVKGQDDDKITKAISGGDPPDVAVSFTTDNVGKFCSSGAWQDLSPLMKDDGVSTERVQQGVDGLHASSTASGAHCRCCRTCTASTTTRRCCSRPGTTRRRRPSAS